MSSFYSLSIDNGYISILNVEKKEHIYIILEEKVLELSELATFLEIKKSVYFSCDQNFIIDEEVKVPVSIKNKSTIKNYLLYHLKKEKPHSQFLFNHSKIQNQLDEENILYQVDGIDEEEYSKSLKVIKNWENIESASLSKFALLALSNLCIDEEAYISVYTSGNKVFVLVISGKEMLFSRANIVLSRTSESLQSEMTTEINQTISYVQQQYRDINFTLIALSGKMAVDDEIPKQLSMLSTLPICVLYPNHLVKNIKNEEGQFHILSLGNLFIPKKYQFFPRSLLGLKQFNLISNILLIVSTFILLTISYFTFNEYNRYSNLSYNYKNTKNKLINRIKQTKTLTLIDLEKSLNHLDIAEKYLKNYPSDIIMPLKPLIMLLNPISWSWQYDETALTLDVKFEKKFQTLLELHNFTIKFNRLFKDINTTFTLSNTPIVDYKKFYYKTEVKITDKRQNRGKKSHRRRVE